MKRLVGTVTQGYGVAGRNLAPVLPLIESRSGLHPLVPNTLNLQLAAPFPVVPDFTVTREEYNGAEEILFQHCRVKGISCLIMRPDTHQRGAFHGAAYLELMSTLWLRKRLHLNDGSTVTVEVDMRPDRRTHGCEACRERRPGALEQLGEPEHIPFMGGKAPAIDTHFRCTTCGAKWVHIVESGAGGHGDYWHSEPA